MNLKATVRLKGLKQEISYNLISLPLYFAGIIKSLSIDQLIGE
jgi:hypothetical protein